MMVERIAAGPVNETDIGVCLALAVEFESLTGMQQHIGDACNGYVVAHGIRAGAHLRRGQIDARIAHAVDRAVSERKTTAGQSDLAEHCSDSDRRPERLLTVVRA